jgi:hypothetical protein
MASMRDWESPRDEVIRMANRIIRDPNSTNAHRIVAYSVLRLLKPKD